MADIDPLATQRQPAADIVSELAAEGLCDAQEIARGGFGVVYRCQQKPLERAVAVKILTADLDEESAERFIQEQHAMGRLSGHPNIVTILHAGATGSGRPYLVMPYHRNESLETQLRRHGPVGWAEAVRLGVKIAGALAAAHRLDILHRDVKPGNILLTEYGEPELTDFGIARTAGGFHTAAGVVLGSPAFTAPELLRGQPASVASDVYGLGATLFSAVTGHAAFERRAGEDVVAQFLRITNEPLPPLHEYDIPADVCAAIEHAMAPEPGHRPATATEYGIELRRIQQLHGLPVDDIATPTALGTQPHRAPTGTNRPRAIPGVGADRVTRDRSRHNIPADGTSFVGRNQEIREIKTLLRKARLLTLTGIGGVGKTRTAKSAAQALQRAFPDGVWLTDFSFVQDGRFVLQAVQDSIPGPGTVSLAEQLGDDTVLLVFDNCDKFTTEVGDIAASLLAQCPHVRILATSRTPLDISAEFVLPVQPFAADPTGEGRSDSSKDAIALFRERAQAASGWKYDTRSESDVIELCHRLDGLPLAIELAALRTRTMSIQDITVRLTDRFGLLHGGPRDMHPRHRSLWTLLEWTWDQCSTAQKSLWAQFSVFAGSASLDAVRSVCVLAGTADTADIVDGLVQQSILVRRQSGDVLRFQMLDTIREFGQVKLERDGAIVAVAVSQAGLRDRHLAYYSTVAAQSESEWFGPNQRRASATATDEIANMRSAFDWAVESGERCAVGAAMVADLWFYWIGCGHLREGRLWSELASDRLRRFGIPHEPRLLWTLGWNLLITGETDRAEQHLKECLAQARRQDDPRATSYGTALLGAVHFFREDFDAGVELYRTAISETRDRGDDLGTAMFLYHLGEAYCIYRQFDLADECCRESVTICERNSDHWCISYARWVQALSAYLQGSYERAEAIARHALATMATIDDQLGIALIGELLAWLAADTGRYSEAATLLGALQSYWSASGTAVMGVHRLIERRDTCYRTIRDHLPDRDITTATAKGAALGIDWIATLSDADADADATASAAAGDGRNRTPDPHPALNDLTPREREIAELVARGMTNKEIAAELIIGKRTVDTHVAHVLAKCGLRRRMEIASLIAPRPDR
ncbi:MAG: protein kinase [Rhodococcus sp. (in: high G+C Gram-positive bacteria)]